MKQNVSIIIPTVNKRPEKLLRSIHSVRHQKQGNIIDQTEIIVSNNSSRVLDGEVLKEQQEGLLQVLDSSAVKGVSFARNQGAAAAKYDILSFLDDDDWWCETFLLELVQTLIEKNVDLVCCGYWSWGTESTKEPGFQPPHTLIEENFFLNHPLMGGSSFIIRKDVFTKLEGFDEKFLTTQDKEFFVRFVKGNYKFYSFQGRLVNVDRTSGWRSTLPSKNKVISQKHFYKLYASEMSPETRQKYQAKIEFNEATANASLFGLVKLLFVFPKKQNIIIRLLEIKIPDRWPRLYAVGMGGKRLAKVAGLWQFAKFVWKGIFAMRKRF